MTDSTPVPEHLAPPKWIAPWLALLAPLYVISPLSLLALPSLKALPRPALYLLGFYALSQQLPALFSPEPLLSSVLALVRTLLMLGLISVGASMKDSQRLKPFALGLGLVYVTALAFSYFSGLDLLTARLSHPYMTPITVGLAGIFGVWLALFASGKLIWRVPLGVVALAVLLLSGSRGPLLAMVLGCVAAFVFRFSRATLIPFALGTLLLLGGLYAGNQLGLNATTRLKSADTNGREIIWANTETIIRAFPVGGVGSYRLGQYLMPPGSQCTVFPDASGIPKDCPAWVSKLGSPWLIAHNLTLQQLAETGPLGLMGLLVLVSVVYLAAWVRRDGLSVAVMTGLLVATITDNTLLLPSPFFAEIFWILAGVQLATLPQFRWWAAPAAFALGSALAAPVLLGNLQRPAEQKLAGLNYFYAPSEVNQVEDYEVFTQFAGPSGDYRANLTTCDRYCTVLDSKSFAISDKTSTLLNFKGELLPSQQQHMKIELYSVKTSASTQLLGSHGWDVTLKKAK